MHRQLTDDKVAAYVKDLELELAKFVIICPMCEQDENGGTGKVIIEGKELTCGFCFTARELLGEYDWEKIE